MVRWHPGPTHVALPNKKKGPTSNGASEKVSAVDCRLLKTGDRRNVPPFILQKKFAYAVDFFSLRDDYRMNNLVRRAILLA
jgi:hypothetical protein